MTTIRVAKRRRFTSVDRDTLNDKTISFKARGVLVWLLDKPDDWTTSQERIEREGIEGREAIASAIKELETAGYIRRTRSRDGHGQWHVEWTVYERPGTASRIPLAVAGNPSTETRTVSTETSDTETDLEPDTISAVEEQIKGQPDCAQCGGIGSYYHAGAGRDRACECTERAEEA